METDCRVARISELMFGKSTRCWVCDRLLVTLSSLNSFSMKQ